MNPNLLWFILLLHQDIRYGHYYLQVTITVIIGIMDLNMSV